VKVLATRGLGVPAAQKREVGETVPSVGSATVCGTLCTDFQGQQIFFFFLLDDAVNRFKKQQQQQQQQQQMLLFSRPFPSALLERAQGVLHVCIGKRSSRFG